MENIEKCEEDIFEKEYINANNNTSEINVTILWVIDAISIHSSNYSYSEFKADEQIKSINDEVNDRIKLVLIDISKLIRNQDAQSIFSS